MLDKEDFEEWVADLKRWPSCGLVMGDDDHSFEWIIGLCTSLYFHAPEETIVAKREQCLAMWLEFQSLVGNELIYAVHPKTDVPHKIGSKRLPDFGMLAKSKPTDETLFLTFVDTDNESTAPGFAFRASVDGYWVETGKRYGYLLLNAPYRWWREHRTAFKSFVLKAARVLEAEQGYMGFKFVDPVSIGAYDFLDTEFALANRLQGLHIDKPFYYRTPRTDLNIGMNAITWGTLIGGQWLAKAGGKLGVLSKLHEPSIHVDELPDALWIEAGPEPALLPVEDGIPHAYNQVAMALKPARTPELNLLTLGRWDDDDSVVFDRDSTQAWLARFDDDGAWPSAEAHKVLPPTAPEVPPVGRTQLRGLPGEAVPASGLWWTPALQGAAGQRQFTVGERFPADVHSDWGAVIWYLQH